MTSSLDRFQLPFFINSLTFQFRKPISFLRFLPPFLIFSFPFSEYTLHSIFIFSFLSFFSLPFPSSVSFQVNPSNLCFPFVFSFPFLLTPYLFHFPLNFFNFSFPFIFQLTLPFSIFFLVYLSQFYISSFHFPFFVNSVPP